MADPHWLAQFDAELRRQRLPARYRARLRDELADHISHFEQENLSMDAQVLLEERLGTPSELAAQARTEFDRRTFAGRHPVLTFGVAPIFAVMGTLIATLLFAWLVAWLACMTTPQLREEKIPPTALQMTVIHGVTWFVRVVPFVIMAAVFARMGRRIHQPRCVLLASAVITFLAFGFFLDIRTATPEVQGQLIFGLAIGKNLGLAQCLQAVVPLAIGLWSFRTIVREQRAEREDLEERPLQQAA
ncbi:MAG: hypothetical protein U0992_08750 [Planctomycetaceae bacterium]